MTNPKQAYWLHHLHPAVKFLAAFSVGLVIFLVPWGDQALLTKLMLSWDGFVLTTLIIYSLIFLNTGVTQIRKKAQEEDTGSIAIFIITLIATLASLLAVLLLVTDSDHEHHRLHIAAAISGMVLSWFLVHTLFTIRYAHLYYAAPADKDEKGYTGGLEFPGTEEPDFRDFAYFAFVIGMTFQVSDVEISSKQIRHISLLHSIISFGYNTAIVALTINIIAGIGGH